MLPRQVDLQPYILFLPDELLAVIAFSHEYDMAVQLQRVNRRLRSVTTKQDGHTVRFWQEQQLTHFPHANIGQDDDAIKMKDQFVKRHKQSYINLKPHQKRWMRLVKTGDLEALKKEKITITDLFISYDHRGNDLVQWASKKKHQHLLDYFFQLGLKELKEYEQESHRKISRPPHLDDLKLAVCFNQQLYVGSKQPQELREKINNISIIASNTVQINVNNPFDCSFATLHLAAKYGHEKMARLLIDARELVNYPNRKLSPLHVACLFGQDNIVKMLIEEFGANPRLCYSSVDYDIQFPHSTLYCACRNDHVNIVRFLINLGVRDAERPFPLHQFAFLRTALSIARQADSIRAMCELLKHFSYPHCYLAIAERGGWNSFFSFFSRPYNFQGIRYLLLKKRLINFIKEMEEGIKQPVRAKSFSLFETKLTENESTHTLVTARLLLQKLEDKISIRNIEEYPDCKRALSKDKGLKYIYSTLCSLDFSVVEQELDEEGLNSQLSLKK